MDETDPATAPDPVRPDSLIADILETRPQAARVLLEEFALPCYRCEVRFTESIGAGASIYGHDPAEVVARLNRCPLRADAADAAPADAAPLADPRA